MNEYPPPLSTVDDLSSLLHLPADELIRIAERASQCYRIRKKKKTNGGFRVYRIPGDELKKVQKLIHRKLLSHFPVHESIYSYRRKRDTVKSALLHVRASVLVQLDIKDFFPSIRPNRVYEMFIQRGCADSVATVLTKLTTCDNQLPQGPPTSPGIANQILTPLARRFSGVCEQHGLKMSTFGDDFYVSGTNRAAQVKNLFVRIIEDEEFAIKPEKTVVSRPGQRKIVAGISVNTKINIPKDKYKKIRAILHNASVRGFHDLFPNLNESKARSRLRGMIGYVSKLNHAKGEQLKKKFMSITGRC